MRVNCDGKLASRSVFLAERTGMKRDRAEIAKSLRQRRTPRLAKCDGTDTTGSLSGYLLQRINSTIVSGVFYRGKNR